MMIELRQLEEKDAPLMLEWMHDKEIQKFFRKDMSKICLEDAQKFCRDAKVYSELKDGDDRHFAIVDERDEYLGTISLKNFELTDATAEYAISLRKKAHGKGIAYSATKLLLKKAFDEYDLNRVYLNVLANNESAIRLYERSGFVYEGNFRNHLKNGSGEYVDLKWYGLLATEFRNSMEKDNAKNNA